MTDSPTILAIIKANQRRFENAKAPQIAAELLVRKRTLAQAVNSAEWHYSGILMVMIVDSLRELHAARETASAPLKPRRKRPRGVSPMLQAAEERPLPPIRRPRG
jgi:hypothetical protein